MQRKVITIGVVACVLALVIAGLSIAQPPARGGRQGGQAGPGQRGPGQRGGQFDPAQMQQRMMERMKEQLGAYDDEWKIMGPRLTKVMELNRQTSGMGRGMMMFGGFGGRGGRPGDTSRGPGGGREPRGQTNRQLTPVETAMQALRTTLQDESASPEQIKNQLTALRAAREKALQNLAVAQQELRQILTMRQEAMLVLMGMLK